MLPHYQRRQEEVNQMMRDMFLAGVSTRRVGEVLAKVKGEKVQSRFIKGKCCVIMVLPGMGKGRLSISARQPMKVRLNGDRS